MPKRKPERRARRIRTPLEKAAARHERAVDRLLLSETLYHSLVEHLPQCILRKDARGVFTFANRRFCELLGLAPRQVLGKTDYDFFPKELADKYRKDDIIVMETGEIFETEEANKPPGQETRYVHVMKTPLRDHRKRIIGVQVLFWDVTAHHRVEEALSRQAALMDALMDTVPDHIFFKDAEGRYLRINRALAAEHGLDDPAKAAGKSDFDFYPREEAERFRQDEQAILRTGQPLITHEERKTYPNGRVVWTSTTKMPIRDPSGRTVGIFGISHDISPLKKAEESLAEQAYLMDSLMGNVPDYIYFKDLQSRFTRVSRAQSDRFGLKDPAEAAGRTDFDFFTREHAEPALRDEQEIIRSGRPVVAKEEKETFPDGSERWVSTTKMPIRDKAGRIVGTFGISHDITGLKEAKDSLAEQADLLGTLLDNVPDFIYFKDASSRFLRVNRALAARHGYDDPRKIVGRTDADLFTPDHAGPALRDEQEILRTGRPIVGKEEKETYTDGSVKWVSTTKMPLRDKNGRIVGTFGISRDITGLKRTEEALAVQAELLTTLMEGVPDRIFFKDAQSRFLRVNRAQAERFGLADPAQAVGRTDFDFFSREEAERFLRDEREIMRTGVPMVGKEEKKALPDGTTRWTSSTKLPLRDRDGRIVGTFGINRDITGLKRAEEAIAEQAELLKTLLDNVPDFIFFKDAEGRFTRVNRALAARLGLEDAVQAVGKTDADFFDRELAEAARKDELEIIRTGRPIIAKEERERFPRGEVIWVSTTKMPLCDREEHIVGTFGISRDITERKRSEEQLVHQAFYDPLTQLPNRALFMDRLGHRFRRARRNEGAPFAVLFLDLDRFKGINDSLGHEAGDNLLVTTARRLETCLRPGDTVARLGGDEFTVLVDTVSDASDAVRIADRVQAALSAACNLAGIEVFTTASIGIALSATHYERPEDMLRDADTAMYRAKAHGKARHEIFDAAMHERAVTQLQLETDLRRAVDRGEFRLFYQPVVAIADGRLTGFEALVRWPHPQRGLILPEAFIPLAEETGLIAPLGLWVLREACLQTCAWQKRFPADPPLRVSVNVSSRQFAQKDFVDQVRRILEETGLDPATLTLEITESAIMENIKATAAILGQIRALSIQLYIDDFGTGYSSLSQIHQFPINTLKVDRSFVSRMSTEQDRSEIVSTIVSMARNLGLNVTAEGVETQEQLELLRRLKCGSAQGFLFSKPLEAADAEALLAKGPQWKAGGAPAGAT